MDQAKDTPVIQLPANDLAVFEYVSTRYDARIGAGVDPEALFVPAFWAHSAVRLKPYDEIRARAEDGTWIAYYLVLDCSRTWAKVALLSFHRLSTADVALSQSSEIEVKTYIDSHQVVHRGPHKWSVIRRADKAVLQEGLGQKEDATAWLERHARSNVGGAAVAREPVTA